MKASADPKAAKATLAPMSIVPPGILLSLLGVVAAGAGLRDIASGAMTLVDGASGTVTVDPDPEVAAAIRLHTVGDEGMSVLEKCIYLADYVEPGRDFPGLDEVRALAETSLDAAVGAAARLTLLDIIRKGRGVVPGALRLYNETHAGQ